MEKYVVIINNDYLLDSYGTFDSQAEAQEWAAAHLKCVTAWIVVLLRDPKD